MQKYLKPNNNNYKLKIRLAKKEDFFFILKLHNQNVRKKKFFSKDQVSVKKHKIWYNKKIQEKMLFVAMFKEKIGYIRYDKINNKYLSISIAIKNKFKRQGFGKYMMSKTLSKKKILDFNILAKIKSQNLISKKFFLNSGFVYYKKDNYILRSKKRLSNLSINYISKFFSVHKSSQLSY